MKKLSVASVLKGGLALSGSIEVAGWVRTRRDSKAGLSFVGLSDGSCFDSLQLIAESLLSNYQTEVLRLTVGCSLRARGYLKGSEGQGQAVELVVEELEVLGWVDEPETYPMAAKKHSLEHLREHAHLRPRTNLIGAVSRLRNSVSQSIHRFFQQEEFVWVHTPIITTADCEGAGEMFQVSTLDLSNLPRNADGQIDYSQDFFGEAAHLTVSGQLSVEAYCLALSKVYTFGPTFRAENSNTSRHLAEFWMVEPEVAFANLDDNAKLAEGMLRYVFEDVLRERQDDLRFFEERVDKECRHRIDQFLSAEFVRIDYTEAIAILEAAAKSHSFVFPVRWGMDLQAEHERYLTENHFRAPCVVVNYPKDIKAFYMRLNDDGKTVAAMDVLAPGIGEIIGGAQREERLDVLDSRIIECGMQPADYEWYRGLRRYGTVPHAGFGLGLERLLIYLSGVANVRDVIPYPRTPGNARF